MSAKTKNSNFSRSNSNFSILTPTFSRDGFYESCFQNPCENSVTCQSIKALQACNIPTEGYFQCKENHFETRPFHAKFEENQ